MALVSVSLTVNFVSYYAGNHRICVSIDGGTTYDCTTIVSCIGFGTACSGVFYTTVDNETCDDVTFDVYVQPTCEEEGSLDKRTYATYTFVPSPACKKYTLTCDNVKVDTINVTNAGSGYTIVPNVTLSGGGGIGATATAALDGMGGITISLTNGGSGYTSAPGVNIDPPDTPGTQAVAVAVLDECEGFSFDTCTGTYSLNSDTVSVGQSIDVCCPTTGGPVITSQFTKALNGNCLCDCEYLTVTVTGASGGITYYANDCDGAQVTGNLTTLSAPLSACIAVDSFYYVVTSGNPTVTTTTGACPP
jgi:hypothetical protein